MAVCASVVIDWAAMQIDPKTLLARWFEEVWNQGREETVDELMAPNAVAVGLGEMDQEVHGPSEFKIFLRNMRQALPDVRIDMEDTTAERDKISARVVLKGTHRGDGLGVPPTGNAVQIRGIVMVRIAGGKIVEGWNSWDQLGLLRQIGALDHPAGSDRFLAR